MEGVPAGRGRLSSPSIGGSARKGEGGLFSIGTNTRCLTYSAGFLLKVTFVRGLVILSKAKNLLKSIAEVLAKKDGTDKNRVKAR